MVSVTLKSPGEVRLEIARRVEECRLRKGLSQRELAKRAGIVLATYKMFARTGIISLDRLIRVAAALGCLGDFDRIFQPPSFQSLDDVLSAQKPARKRIRK